MDRSNGQIQKENQYRNIGLNKLDQMDLIYIYRERESIPNLYIQREREHSIWKQNTFFSSAHETVSRTDYILGHKTSLSKFKEIEIISSIFSNHNAMRLKINYKEKTAKNKHVEAKTYATKQPMDQWINQRGNKIPRD